ncbi:APC family permease [Streptomyces sp. NPDC048297]|uniref:APC family permease n=1 Tax=Streptomyces sp. NPDC048297 TaxID=3365531 RepID=UPI003713022A
MHSEQPSRAAGGLRTGVLGTFDSVVMAVAGCAPAYTVVAMVPALIAAVGSAAPAVLLLCALPTVGIALAFRHLGRLDVNCGATYSWVARTLHPVLGFLSGWAVIVATTVFMISSTEPAGAATLSLVSENLARNEGIATAVGLGWFLLVAALVALGARIGARARSVAVGLQLALLLVVAVAALARGGHADALSLTWPDFGHLDNPHGFTAGALIAGALFWGWDVTANLSEETRRGRGGSGLGGLIGLLVTAATYLLMTVGATMVLGPRAGAQGGDFLRAFGDAALPGVGGDLLVLAVLLSTVATLETTLLQATRTLFAMGRDRTVPSFLGRLHAGRQTPVVSTLVVACLAVLVLGLIAFVGRGFGILALALVSIGLLICFYYALAGLAVVVAFRSVVFRSLGNLLFLGLWPLAGAAFNIWLFAVSVPVLDATELSIGLGALALGLVPVTVARLRGGSSYFRPRPLNPKDADALDAHLAEAAPFVPAAERRDGILSDF